MNLPRLIALMSFCALGALTLFATEPNFTPTEGFVPNEDTAISTLLRTMLDKDGSDLPPSINFSAAGEPA